MKHHKYLIIGGGLAGNGGTKGIRELDTEGSIGMISMEIDPPYMRPNLSKGLWKGRPEEKIWRKREERAELHVGRKVDQLDPAKKCVLDNEGDEYEALHHLRRLEEEGGMPSSDDLQGLIH